MLGFLEKYEFLATWLELSFFIFVFIFFEFKKYRKEKENDIQEKIKAIISRVYELLLIYLGEKKTKNKAITKKQIPIFLKKIFHEYEMLKTLPEEFYNDLFFDNLFLNCKNITFKDLANAISILQERDYVYNNKNRIIIFTVFFNSIKKYFKNNQEIEKIYNNIVKQ